MEIEGMMVMEQSEFKMIDDFVKLENSGNYLFMIIIIANDIEQPLIVSIWPLFVMS